MTDMIERVARAMRYWASDEADSRGKYVLHGGEAKQYYPDMETAYRAAKLANAKAAIAAMQADAEPVSPGEDAKLRPAGEVWKDAYTAYLSTNIRAAAAVIEADRQQCLAAKDAEIARLREVLRDARTYIDGASPDWHYAKQDALMEIDVALKGDA